MVLPLILAGGAAFGALSERYQWIWVPNYRDARVKVTGTDFDVEARAFALAKNHLISEEGRREKAYIDPRGFLTVGIGHKVLSADKIVVGQTISQGRIDDFFAKDAAKAFDAAVSQAKDLKRYNPDMIARLTSVNFQLGTNWRAKFPNTWTLLVQGKSSQVISNLLQSDWYKQTPTRVALLISTIRQQYA